MKGGGEVGEREREREREREIVCESVHEQMLKHSIYLDIHVR